MGDVEGHGKPVNETLLKANVKGAQTDERTLGPAVGHRMRKPHFAGLELKRNGLKRAGRGGGASWGGEMTSC